MFEREQLDTQTQTVYLNIDNNTDNYVGNMNNQRKCTRFLGIKPINTRSKMFYEILLEMQCPQDQ